LDIGDRSQRPPKGVLQAVSESGFLAGVSAKPYRGRGTGTNRALQNGTRQRRNKLVNEEEGGLRRSGKRKILLKRKKKIPHNGESKKIRAEPDSWRTGVWDKAQRIMNAGCKGTNYRGLDAGTPRKVRSSGDELRRRDGKGEEKGIQLFPSRSREKAPCDIL